MQRVKLRVCAVMHRTFFCTHADMIWWHCHRLQFGPRLGLTECRPWPGSKQSDNDSVPELFDTLDAYNTLRKALSDSRRTIANIEVNASVELALLNIQQQQQQDVLEEVHQTTKKHEKLPSMQSINLRV